MSHDRFAARRERLLRRLKTASVEALLVTSPFNVRYLTGFTGEDSALVIGRGLTVLVSDSRFETQISQECPGLEARIRPNTQPLTEAIAQVVVNAKLSKIGFEGRTTSYAQWESLSTAAKAVQLVQQADHVESLRIIKDSDEVFQIREAIHQAERGFNLLKASLRGEMSELQSANELEYAMRCFGAKQASFESIIAVGPRAALPHARPTNMRIDEANFVLIDWGATNIQGYHSDLTRVLATGTISPKLEKLHGVVLTAQQRAIEAIRPGIAAAEVDSIGREVIAKAGWGKNFGHGLGHGIGLEIHEGPRFSRASKDILKAGMVVTVEPGIYLPGFGGTRIEDDVLVTRDGHEVLSSLPREFACTN
jgi:Xaa-Pro aminopeptidase